MSERETTQQQKQAVVGATHVPVRRTHEVPGTKINRRVVLSLSLSVSPCVPWCPTARAFSLAHKRMLQGEAMARVHGRALCVYVLLKCALRHLRLPSRHPAHVPVAFGLSFSGHACTWMTIKIVAWRGAGEERAHARGGGGME